ncbi:unnamed protein product [Rotaria sp. Silwood1]|nr:unnamed protein product [Rotaria sp. Silwood1]CAF3480253.1 unnamed protein product [Rotaria sp. Silwood1]CAF3485055.1 unnamed protein product [Rotaria sp. Silwood1]CAF4701326.1 unnamed protein product [Rotaria sp. Silwood1]CAF4765559.1 unnamed protein product [Rotaria sp. Silwood1]
MITTESIGKDSNENLYDVIIQKLESLSKIKFAAYRVACKLRVLQKYLKLSYVDYNVLVRAFNTHQLQFGVETRVISSEDARKVLIAIYQLISSYHFNEISIEEIVEVSLKFLYEILNIKLDEDLDVNSFKIILFALSNARLPEKYRCFFRQITSPNVIASQVKLTELFEILLKLPNHFDNVDSFHADNIPACVQSCLDHTHDGVIREDIFVNWMSREPQTIVWLPTLHRLIATETVRHEAQCNVCKAYPVIGMRYRCLRCFNFDLCQTCFFTGDHGQNHDGTHPIEEYCKQVTPFEDLKAFFEFIKLKVGKNELKRKERYLTIERSKSSSDVQIPISDRLVTKEHYSLNRQDQTIKKPHLQDIYRPIEKTETNEISSHEEEKIPLTTHNNSSIDEKKKLNNDESLVNNEEIKTKILNYITIEKKKIPSPNQIQLPEDDDAPILMPKQHKPIKKSLLMNQHTEALVQSEHYQLPPIDKANVNDEDDDEYRPPLPPKQRQKNNISRALVYDFIGSELQELRATLAQFDQSSSSIY